MRRGRFAAACIALVVSAAAAHAQPRALTAVVIGERLTIPAPKGMVPLDRIPPAWVPMLALTDKKGFRRLGLFVPAEAVPAFDADAPGRLTRVFVVHARSSRDLVYESPSGYADLLRELAIDVQTTEAGFKASQTFSRRSPEDAGYRRMLPRFIVRLDDTSMATHSQGELERVVDGTSQPETIDHVQGQVLVRGRDLWVQAHAVVGADRRPLVGDALRWIDDIRRANPAP